MRYEGTARASRAFADRDGTRVVVSTLGPGSLGGDCVTIEGNVGAGAHLTVTSQSATRVYGPGSSWFRARWTVAAGATLELHPEPVMLFSDADYVARTEIDLVADARLCVLDVAGLGERAPARARIVTIVRRDGRLAVRDAILLDEATLCEGAVGSLIAFGFSVCGAEDQISPLRAGQGSTLHAGRFVRVTGRRAWDVREALSAAAARVANAGAQRTGVRPG